MGLNDPKQTNKTYLNIVSGRLARRYKKHQEVNGKQVTIDREIKNKKGEVIKTVIERHYESVEGLIVSASIDTSGDFGSRLVFELLDDGDEFTVQIPVESSYGRSILLRIPNIDPEFPVTIYPYSFENKEGKNQTGITVYQEGCGWEKDKVPYKWTKDEPGSLPDWEFAEVAGKKKWNSDKQTNFLCKHFDQWANNIGAIEVENVNENAAEILDEAAMDDMPVDDLPF